MVEFPRREDMVRAQCDGFEPELTNHAFPSYVNVWWLIAVEMVLLMKTAPCAHPWVLAHARVISGDREAAVR